MRDDLKLKMKEVEAKKQGTEQLLEEMGVQRSEAEAQQVSACHITEEYNGLSNAQIKRHSRSIA